MGPAMPAILLVDRELTFDIVVNVVDVIGGTASGETQYKRNCFVEVVNSFMSIKTAILYRWR